MSNRSIPLWLLILVGSCLMFVVISWVFFSNEGVTTATDQTEQVDIERHVDVNLPKSQWTPEEVVELQVKSMHEGLADPEKLVTCYSLASPENRQTTGPFERFAAMIMMPPYDELATCKEWKVGVAVLDEDFADVPVKTVTNSGEETIFRFVLRQQSRAPYRGCWLTEAVVIEQR